MKTCTKSELAEVLRLHKLWLLGDKAGVRINLRGSDLRGSDLSGSDLSGSNLSWQSHDLLSEILRRAAGADEMLLRLAGLLMVHRSWCWPEWLEWAKHYPADARWMGGVLLPIATEKSPAPKELVEFMAVSLLV
jgi:hypothetical protein